MRQIDEQTRDAFINRKRFKSSNTKVEILNGDSHLYLHGNLIAKMEMGNPIKGVIYDNNVFIGNLNNPE